MHWFSALICVLKLVKYFFFVAFEYHSLVFVRALRFALCISNFAFDSGHTCKKLSIAEATLIMSYL